jgi:hypothetical protein
MSIDRNGALGARAFPRGRFSQGKTLIHLFTLLLALVVMAPARAQGAPVATGAGDAGSQAQGTAAAIRIRIGVLKDGVTAIGPADLSAAGIDPAQLDPRSFALESLGQPVAIWVTGDADGKFNGADRVYFFGQKFRGAEMDQKYTDERVYWLTSGGTPGPRMSTAAADPQFDRTPPADFATTLRAEENTQWWTLHTIYLDTQDTWFWARSQPARLLPKVDVTVTATLPYTVPNPAPGTPATFRLEQISRVARWDLVPDHHTTIALNGKTVADEDWDGLRVRKVFSVALGTGDLQDGVNTVTVANSTLPDVWSDDIYTNYWEIDYRRQFKAYRGQLDFLAETGGTQEYEVAGWQNTPVWIWDVSNAGTPVRLTLNPKLERRLFLPLQVRTSGDAGATPGAPVSIRFRATGPAGSRYWLQAWGTFNAPASIRLRPPTGLRSPGKQVDVVLVAPAFLKAAAQPLAQWHESQGRHALIVDVQDVYDEFNYGIYHPKAIQAMMKWASTNWPAPTPQYLTLVGDGHWNFKGYNPALYPPQPNPIPPYLAWVDIWQGEVPTDARFGDINDDSLPEIAVGRLPVNTPDEAKVVIDKIINYDQGTRTQAWQKRAVFVADNADYSGDFAALSDQIISGYLPADLQPVRDYLPPNSADQATQNQQVSATRSAILADLQQGALMVQYAGHGAPERWAAESTDSATDTAGIWRAGDIDGLQNGSKLPVVMTFNCLDGYFVHPSPSTFSMAELMLRHPGGGSIAAISPTGLGMTEEQDEFRKILLNVIFKDNVRELGRALTITKQQFSQKYGRHYLIDTMTLFGDPALRLPAQGAQ